MKFIDTVKRIERLDSLIRRKSTGNPKSLAHNLQISERSIYNLINNMKDLGAPIYYCSYRQSYCYEYNVNFSFGFKIEENTLLMIRGGSKSDLAVNLSLMGEIDFICFNYIKKGSTNTL